MFGAMLDTQARLATSVEKARNEGKGPHRWSYKNNGVVTVPSVNEVARVGAKDHIGGQELPGVVTWWWRHEGSRSPRVWDPVRNLV